EGRGGWGVQGGEWGEGASRVGGGIAQRDDHAIDTLDGDFAVVAWNPRARRVIAARDPLGNRPLHWTEHDGALLLASDIVQLLDALPAVPPPDESVAADLLAFDPASEARTAYRGVSRIPPGAV